MLLFWFAVVCYYFEDVVTVILIVAAVVDVVIVVVAAAVGVGLRLVFVICCRCFAVVALLGCLLFAKWFAMFAMLLCFECCCLG